MFYYKFLILEIMFNVRPSILSFMCIYAIEKGMSFLLN
jgi:hypothetical protein